MYMNYINKKDLKNELEKYHHDGIITEELGKMILSMAESYASASGFRGYSYIKDMVGQAILQVIKSLNKIDPNNNAFGYISSIIRNEFLQFLRKEKRQKEIKDILNEEQEN